MGVTWRVFVGGKFVERHKVSFRCREDLSKREDSKSTNSRRDTRKSSSTEEFVRLKFLSDLINLSAWKSIRQEIFVDKTKFSGESFPTRSVVDDKSSRDKVRGTRQIQRSSKRESL